MALGGGSGPMIAYVLQRVLYAIPTLILISIVSFVLIELPPGDYLQQRIAELEQRYGDSSSMAQADQLRARYGLDRPLWRRYVMWVGGALHGDLGQSFRYEQPVNKLIGDRVLFTIVLSLAALIVSYAIAIPAGIFSATHRNTWGDYVISSLAFIGMSLPGFLLALLLLVVGLVYFDVALVGLFSPRYADAPWSFGKFIDLLNHLWIPTLIVGVNGTAGLMRIMRSNLLDVLGQQFVQTARAKGLRERVVVTRHAVRIAINPLISILGMSLPGILSGSTIISIVLNLPTMGPLLFQSLKDQDMYLAGSQIMMFSLLLIVGNLLADVALAWVDPRIRYGQADAQ